MGHLKVPFTVTQGKPYYCYAHDGNYFGLVLHYLDKVCVLHYRVHHLQSVCLFLFSVADPVLSTITGVLISP